MNEHISLFFVLIVISIFMGILIFLRSIFLGSRRPKRIDFEYPYVKRNALFTPAERSFLGVLDVVFDEHYRIFGKTRIADIVDVVPGLERGKRRGAFNRISSKHFDFVVCRASDLGVEIVIELDDKSHNQSRRKERDAFVEKTCEACKLPLLRVPAKGMYSAKEVADLIAHVMLKNQMENETMPTAIDDGR